MHSRMITIRIPKVKPGGAQMKRGGRERPPLGHCRSVFIQLAGGETPLTVSTISSGSLAISTLGGRTRLGRGVSGNSSEGAGAKRVSTSSRPESGGSVNAIGGTGTAAGRAGSERATAGAVGEATGASSNSDVVTCTGSGAACATGASEASRGGRGSLCSRGCRGSRGGRGSRGARASCGWGCWALSGIAGSTAATIDIASTKLGD